MRLFLSVYSTVTGSMLVAAGELYILSMVSQSQLDDNSRKIRQIPQQVPQDIAA